MSLSVSAPLGQFAPASIIDSIYRPVNVSDLVSQDVQPAWGTLGARIDGGYNYCSMPHPNAANYEPIANGTLVYLEYFQRHQRRTPYNILAGDAFYCDDINVLTGDRLSYWQNEPSAVVIETPNNALTNINGTCQYPQLTSQGYSDALQHGSDLGLLYGELLRIIPRSPTPDSVKVRVSNSRLTEGTANGVLQGIFGSLGSNVPLHQQPANYDTVNSGFTCARRVELQKAQRQTPEWKQHLSAINSTLNTLNSTSFTDGFAVNPDWTVNVDHLADNFQAKFCNQYAVDLNSNLYNPIFNAGDWEWDYYWRSGPNHTDYARSVSGLFIAEVIERIKNPGTLQYHHTFAHDGDIGPLAGTLGVEYLRWPGMGSNIAIEVWEVHGSKKIRVLYCGSPIRSTSGLDLGSGVDLDSFVNYWQQFTLPDASWCNDT